MNNEKSQRTLMPWLAKAQNPAKTYTSVGTNEDPTCVAIGCKPADARLIAAAPELLDIAHRWMAWATGPVVPIAVRMQLQEDTRAAIAKVEGKS